MAGLETNIAQEMTNKEVVVKMIQAYKTPIALKPEEPLKRRICLVEDGPAVAAEEVCLLHSFSEPEPEKEKNWRIGYSGYKYYNSGYKNSRRNV